MIDSELLNSLNDVTEYAVILDNSKEGMILECKKCGVTYLDTEGHKCDKFHHHGSCRHSIDPYYIGTDYFAFFCHICNRLMDVIKIRQCDGNKNDKGRLIFNCECTKCGRLDAIKLHTGKTKCVMVEQCIH